MRIWVPFSWTQRTLKVKSGGHLELWQGTGLHWADIRLWGIKGPSIRPRCIGTVRARTQMLINQSLEVWTIQWGSHGSSWRHGMWSVPALLRRLLSPSSGQKMESSWFLVNVGNTYWTTRYITEHNVIIIMHIVHNSSSELTGCECLTQLIPVRLVMGILWTRLWIFACGRNTFLQQMNNYKDSGTEKT